MKIIRNFSTGFFSAFILTISGVAVSAQANLKFEFGHLLKPGWTQISPTNDYSAETGFGFEPHATVKDGEAAVSDQPFYFSVRVPEGNYRVTAVLGGQNESTTTVKAELRRLMLEKIHTAAGKYVTRTFVVNVRTPNISKHNQVHLKPRERTGEMWDWDNKLTLEFNGAHPSVRSLEIVKVIVPTVFLIGDSTVCDQPAEPWNSWGQMLPRFFKPDIAVANHAESGETVADSLRAQRFEKIFSQMKAGDYLLVQFGHNDQKNKAPNALDNYKTDLKKVIARTRVLGGTPILITSMERKAGMDHDTLAGYPDAVRKVSNEEDCALIDLNFMSRAFYKALGPNLDKAFQDGTHHNAYGSYELAKCVIEGIKKDRLALADYIVDDFGDFDPSHPDSVMDFQMPASPVNSTVKPLGN